jgi:hypothetical protein
MALRTVFVGQNNRARLDMISNNFVECFSGRILRYSSADARLYVQLCQHPAFYRSRHGRAYRHASCRRRRFRQLRRRFRVNHCVRLCRTMERMRWSMNQAVFWIIPKYLASWTDEIPFLSEVLREIASNHFCKEM